MDSRTAAGVHPAYVSLLSELSPQEAVLLCSLKKRSNDNVARRDGDSALVEHWPAHHHGPPLSGTIETQFIALCGELGFEGYKESSLVWLENLKRLSLVDVSNFSEHFLQENSERPRIATSESRYLSLTPLGEAFLQCCLEPSHSLFEEVVFVR